MLGAPDPLTGEVNGDVPVNEVTIDECIGAVELSEPRLDRHGRRLGYFRRDGELVQFVWCDVSAGGVPGRERRRVMTPPARLGRGLGGGCWSWTERGDIVYAAADGNLWWCDVGGGAARPITEHGPDRVAQAPSVSPSGVVAYVVDQAEVWVTTLSTGQAQRIDDGTAGFCFDPDVRDGDGPGRGAVTWLAWSEPHMPWDGAHAEVWHADGGRRRIEASGAVQQPRFTPDGQVMCLRDDHGWNNLWVDDRPLLTEEYEHGGPTWGLGQRSFALAPSGDQVAFTRNESGFGRLCVLDTSSGAVRDLGRGVHGQVTWAGAVIAAVRTGARTPPEIVLYRADAGERAVVSTSARHGRWASLAAEPTAVRLHSADGETLHARFYPPAQDTGRLLCWLHGGPTDQWQVTFMPRIVYWNQRGWGVLVPDHRGSTGHGRAYQQALRGRWGELDVADTCAALEHAHRVGWSTPASTALIGGSAGGFTVLGVARTAPFLASAAVVAYPVTDLADLVERSHRFERHATHGLVGDLEVEGVPERYRKRSPAWFASEIELPLLVLHGDVDPVVPVQQSRVLVERIRAVGGEVELCIYAGEGHGFRDPANQRDEYRRIGDFLHRHVP